MLNLEAKGKKQKQNKKQKGVVSDEDNPQILV